MGKDNNFCYLVEGQCERKIIDTLKSNNLICAGKIIVLNVVQELVTDLFLRTIKPNTTIILVFDTDKPDVGILSKNLSTLNKSKQVKDVLCVLQVRNLEDELSRSTGVSDLKRITGSKSNKDFKTDLIREKKLYEKLNKNRFNIKTMWSQNPPEEYIQFKNDGYKIKKNTK